MLWYTKTVIKIYAETALQNGLLMPVWFERIKKLHFKGRSQRDGFCRQNRTDN